MASFFSFSKYLLLAATIGETIDEIHAAHGQDRFDAIKHGVIAILSYVGSRFFAGDALYVRVYRAVVDALGKVEYGSTVGEQPGPPKSPAEGGA